MVTDAVRPGVVQLRPAPGTTRTEPGGLGALDKHGNPNVLTLDKGTSRLGQGPIAHTRWSRSSGSTVIQGQITAFVPPTLERRA